jgi:hypothetical protein
MSIVPRREITHPELGSLYFNDDAAVPGLAGSKDKSPQWVCEPYRFRAGSGFEIYLPGDSDSPRDLDRAITALHHRKQVEAQGRQLSCSNVYLGWIDLMVNPPSVASLDNVHTYGIW